MRACPQCGEGSDERSRFCWSCGAPLAPGTRERVREARKVVTVLFCDVVGSTAIGERHDPERVRLTMSRYFEEMAAIVRRHGGTVDKFIGDAVMAVFGVPVLHEDDALRAVRAATEMQQALEGLSAEFERATGDAFRVRIGINTGETIVAEGPQSDSLLTGDTVNTAKRLESAAGPGEILIGEETCLLTRAAVLTEPLAPLTVKGKARPLAAHRVLGLAPAAHARARAPRAGFVGRERELALVRDMLARAERARSCHLLTVLGQPGVGKSRLVREAVLGDGGARLLEGACLPYGEGTTFWPLVEIVGAASGGGPDGELRDGLARLLDGEPDAAEVIEGVAELVEGGGEGRRPEERFWALRRLLETLARHEPVVVVIDDVQWAEAALLDLVEHIAEWAREAALLLVCIARPELIEIRPAWGGGRFNAGSILLEPLTAAESERLIAERLAAVDLPAATRARVLEAAEGFPLFVEEMVSLLLEEGAADVRVPPTIGLLLASRIDRLPAEEREVLEWAAVEGRVFHVAAVAHLARGGREAELPALLERLVRKELIGPDGAGRGDEVFHFRHVLIRDAAYDAIPKRARAGLHERFAEWLTGSGDGAAQELVGYHLEQAFRYRKELHGPQPEDLELAARAAAVLGAAGSRARRRGDAGAAAKLLARAVALQREQGAPPPETLIELGSVLIQTGDFGGGDDVFAEAVALARERGERRQETWAALERAYVRLQVDSAYDSDHLLEAAENAIAVFEALGDDAGVAAALTRVAEAHWSRCRLATTEEVLEQALVHATRAGDRVQALEILELLGRAIVVGPRPVGEAVSRCHEILEQARGEPRLTAWTRSMLAVLLAMRGEAGGARELYRTSQEGLAELGLKVLLAGAQMYAGMAELVLGDPAEAERQFRLGYEALVEIGEQSTLSTMAAFLARALAAQERFEEVEALSVVSERAASESDLASQVLWRGARARALAARGEAAAAERLAGEAVAASCTADFISTRADVLMDLAHVRRAGGGQGAEEAAAEALALYEAKGNAAAAAQARLTALGPVG